MNPFYREDEYQNVGLLGRMRAATRAFLSVVYRDAASTLSREVKLFFVRVVGEDRVERLRLFLARRSYTATVHSVESRAVGPTIILDYHPTRFGRLIGAGPSRYGFIKDKGGWHPFHGLERGCSIELSSNLDRIFREAEPAKLTIEKLVRLEEVYGIPEVFLSGPYDCPERTSS